MTVMISKLLMWREEQEEEENYVKEWLRKITDSSKIKTIFQEFEKLTYFFKNYT